jgi:hypothetical protein
MTCYLPLPPDPRFEVPEGAIPLLEESRPSLWDTSALIEGFVDALRSFDYDPAVDYIVLTGRAAYLAFLTIAVWEYMDERYPEDSGVTFKVYDASASRYKEVRVRRHAKSR